MYNYKQLFKYDSIITVHVTTSILIKSIWTSNLPARLCEIQTKDPIVTYGPMKKQAFQHYYSRLLFAFIWEILWVRTIISRTNQEALCSG